MNSCAPSPPLGEYSPLTPVPRSTPPRLVPNAGVGAGIGPRTEAEQPRGTEQIDLALPPDPPIAIRGAAPQPPGPGPAQPEWVMMVDGAADDSRWGVGVAVTDSSLSRQHQDPLARWDITGGGDMQSLLPRFRRGITRRADGDAVAEAIALAVGLSHNLVICRHHGWRRPMDILVDRTATITLLAGGGRASPSLAAAIAVVIFRLWWLAHLTGPVTIRPKHHIPSLQSHEWLPDRLAAAGKRAGNMVVVDPPEAALGNENRCLRVQLWCTPPPVVQIISARVTAVGDHLALGFGHFGP